MWSLALRDGTVQDYDGYKPPLVVIVEAKDDDGTTRLHFFAAMAGIASDAAQFARGELVHSAAVKGGEVQFDRQPGDQCRTSGSS